MSLRTDIAYQAAASIAPLGAVRTVVLAAALAGTLDICAAMASVQVRGIPALQAVKGVAAGWLGAQAFKGGAGVVALGFISHFLIMAAFAAAFYFASRAWPTLAKQWLASGALYGLAVFLFMTFVVVPLSAFPRLPAPTPLGWVRDVLIHVACVGLPIAFVTRRGLAAASIAGEGP